MPEEAREMVYWMTKLVARILLRILFCWRASGVENVPRRGRVILCANHISWWDPVILACSLQRRVYFMAKEELFSFGPFRWFLRALGAFPVRRGQPDRAAIRHALQLLQEGKVVGIFPEGTRSRTGVLGRSEPGAALLAVLAKAPVIPVLIRGPYRFRAPVSVTFGHQFYLQRTTRRSHELGRLGGEILSRIAELSEESASARATG